MEQLKVFTEKSALLDSILRKTQKDQKMTKDPYYPKSVNQHPCYQGVASFLSVSVFPNTSLRLVVILCCPFRVTERNPLVQLRDVPVGDFFRAHI